MEPGRDSAFPPTAPTSTTEWDEKCRAVPAGTIEADHVLIVSPHPDDETLGAGGIAADLVAGGVAAQVLTATDGEGSHSGWDVAALRRREQDAALKRLRLPPSDRLSLPDTAVTAYVDEVASAIAERCDHSTVVLAPWEHDGHGDHDAVGRAAQLAARRTGSVLLEYFVWTWPWATPDAVGHLDLRCHALSPAARVAKAEALGCYRSQLSDMDGDAVIRPALTAAAGWPFEVLVHPRLVDGGRGP